MLTATSQIVSLSGFSQTWTVSCSYFEVACHIPSLKKYQKLLNFQKAMLGNSPCNCFMDLVTARIGILCCHGKVTMENKTKQNLYRQA